MDEREVRRRLSETAGSFQFGYQGSDVVIRRTRTRMVVMRTLAATLAVAVVAAVGTLSIRADGPIASTPEMPVGGLDDQTFVAGDYLLDLVTGEETPLPATILVTVAEGVSDRYAVPADGSRLAFVGTDGLDNPQIFIADLEGTSVSQVTQDPEGASSPAWSPDGTKLVYEGGGADGIRNLYVLEVATGEVTQLTDLERRCSGCPLAPQVTPDGSSVIYEGGTGESPVVRRVPITGGKNTLFLGPGGGATDAGNASISPDGSRVTFIGGGSPPSGEFEQCGPCRWMANTDGTDREAIDTGCWITNPAGTWSPDGKRIACWDGHGVSVLDLATGETSQVADGTGAIWLDRNTLLVEVCRPPTGCERPYAP